MPTITADGRDLTHAEWRTVPGFPKYQVTPDGDVRNRRTGKLLNEWHNPVTDRWAYTLFRDDGTHTSRNYASLIRDTYPETEGT